MGEIFLARHRNAVGVEVLTVVKRIFPHLSRDPDFVSYFRHEGRISSLLHHPNIVHTMELGQVNGQYYIAMEYLPGPTLVRLLATALAGHTQLSIPLILHLALQISGALDYLHTLPSVEGLPLGIIHMDLAPHNILVSADGLVKLLDFGIARARGLDPAKLRRDFRGRTAYLAPEQLDGLALDQRVDLFAFGIILHEMVMVRPLFRSSSENQTVSRILYAPIPRLRRLRSDCPEELERIILRALERDRDQRYQSAGELLSDLDGCVARNGIVFSLLSLREELSALFEQMQQPSALTQISTGPKSFELRNTSRPR